MLLEHYKKVAFNKGPAMKLKLGFLVTNFVYNFSDSQKSRGNSPSSPPK